jgi:hypothetical protein
MAATTVRTNEDPSLAVRGWPPRVLSGVLAHRVFSDRWPGKNMPASFSHPLLPTGDSRSRHASEGARGFGERVDALSLWCGSVLQRSTTTHSLLLSQTHDTTDT